MSTKTDTKNTAPKQTYISMFALAMMNVAIVAGISNDVQQSFYGLSSVTLFAIGAIVFFIPTALVAAELAGGWSERGGIFRWVGEGLGKGLAFSCLLILWFQTTFTFGSGMPSYAATIGFFTSDFDWAVNFAKNPQHELLIMCGWIALYWVLAWIATKGVKAFSNITKYGVFIGSLIPLALMIILAIVWLAQGNKPAISMAPKNLIPKWNGMSTLALAAGVFFSYAGIDMNAAHIKQLKNPRKAFPGAIFIAMILSFLIFVIGTVIIAMIIPEKDINVLYTLYAVFRELGSTIGAPWLYMVFVYAMLFNTIANIVTNLAGPSYMLGQAGRSGFLPKWLQSNNKHGMPSRLMYFQMACMTVIAFVVKLLPNVEGFVILITQSVTILYMLYYVFMFIAFIRLRYTQPNRPRSFTVPGGKFGAWLIAGVGLLACIFGITLSLYPPAQIAKEVGSGTTYVTVILVLIAIVLLVCFGLYQLSKKRNWVDPDNQFAPFTWEIEGLKKPKKVLSNIPTDMLSKDQNPMGMPIKKFYDPNQTIVLPAEYQYDKKKNSHDNPSPPSTGTTTSSPAATAVAPEPEQTTKKPTTSSVKPTDSTANSKTDATPSSPTDSADTDTKK